MPLQDCCATDRLTIGGARHNPLINSCYLIQSLQTSCFQLLSLHLHPTLMCSGKFHPVHHLLTTRLLITTTKNIVLCITCCGHALLWFTIKVSYYTAALSTRWNLFLIHIASTTRENYTLLLERILYVQLREYCMFLLRKYYTLLLRDYWRNGNTTIQLFILS